MDIECLPLVPEQIVITIGDKSVTVPLEQLACDSDELTGMTPVSDSFLRAAMELVGIDTRCGVGCDYSVDVVDLGN